MWKLTSAAEVRGTDTVPGTGLLTDNGIVHGHEFSIDEAKDLKRGTGKHAHVVLMPQPSDDPRDPYVSVLCSRQGAYGQQAELAQMEERSVFLDIVSEHVWNVWALIDGNCVRAFAASLDGALSPMVGPGYVLLSQQFNVSVDNITSSFGFILLGLGTFM